MWDEFFSLPFGAMVGDRLEIGGERGISWGAERMGKRGSRGEREGQRGGREGEDREREREREKPRDFPTTGRRRKIYRENFSWEEE